MDASASLLSGPGSSSLSSMPSSSSQSVRPNIPESPESADLYYTDLEEDRGGNGSSSSEGESAEGNEGDDDDNENVHEIWTSKGKRNEGGSFENRRRKGVAFADSPPGTPFTSHERPSSRKQDSRWYDLDLSLVVALVSPIGNWLTGSDHIKNLFLILLLIFYLHQLIEMPWQLYHASRPRKSAKQPLRQSNSHHATLANLARAELRRQEFFYLALAVISPLIGAYLIRYVLTALEGVDSLSWFSTTLFVLATGIRPWSHLIGRLQERTHALHDTVHYPPEESDARHKLEIDRTLQSILRRLDALDHSIQELEQNSDSVGPLREVCDDLSEAIGSVERTMTRIERKTETTRVTQETRLNQLETGIVELEARRRQDREAVESKFRLSTYTNMYGSPQSQFYSLMSNFFSLPSKLVPWLMPYAGSFFPRSNTSSSDDFRNSIHLAPPRRSPSFDHPTSPSFLSRLETIPEADDSDTSDKTYVSDKDLATPSKAGVNPRKSSRSRSRSVSDGGKNYADPQNPVTFVAYATDIVSWPYRSAVQVLFMITPPVQKLFS